MLYPVPMADSNVSSFPGGMKFALVIAAVILIGIVIALFVFNPHKTLDLSVTKVQIFAPHTQFESMPGSTHVIGQAPSSEDDLYVVAHVRMTDKLRIPIFLSDWSAVLKLSDGTLADATTVPSHELPRLEQIFPAITPLIAHPIDFGDELTPGATQEGDIILLFPNTTQSVWQKKQTAVLTINLRNQGPQTATIP